MDLDLSAVASFPQTLTIMGLGMLGIFVVTLAIVLVIVLLNVITNPRKKKDAK